MVCRQSWCRCLEWRENDIYETSCTILRRKIHPQWCWLHLWFVGQVPVLVQVIAHICAAGISDYLDLLLYLFFYPHHDSYVTSLGVLQVSLLLSGCPTFEQIGLDTQPVWTLLFCPWGSNNLLCYDQYCDGICNIWSHLTPVWELSLELA